MLIFAQSTPALVLAYLICFNDSLAVLPDLLRLFFGLLQLRCHLF